MSTLFLTYVRNKVDLVPMAITEHIHCCAMLLFFLFFYYYYYYLQCLMLDFYGNGIPVLRKFGIALSEHE